MIQGMHLTHIGNATLLLEPGAGLDPGDPDSYLEPLAAYLQQADARRLIYDLSEVPIVDALYYSWLTQVHAIARICGVRMIAAGMNASAAYALAATLNETPPFVCALDVDRAR
jgi:rsbT antagonist protein RsbS